MKAFFQSYPSLPYRPLRIVREGFFPRGGSGHARGRSDARTARGARGHDACRCVRPPARRGYVLALVAHFELSWERAATCAWRFAPVTLQLCCCRRNLCSVRSPLSLCRVDCSECSDRGRADLAAGPRTMNAPASPTKNSRQ
jgi:hypothetical protein